MSRGTIRIVEVGPRDGLQSRGSIITVEQRIKWIQLLIASGLREVEAGSFVRPDLVPSMAASDEIFQRSKIDAAETLWALIPNMKGLQRAQHSGAKAFAFFTSASETFSQKNASCSVAESLAHFQEIRKASHGSQLRAYISCSFGCPYEATVEASAITDIALELEDIGADEVVVSDTIGNATSKSVTQIVGAVSSQVKNSTITLHLHDTNGSALESAQAGLETGVLSFDSSAGGLGGCPFAPGAPGNVATEDLVTLFESKGYSTGIDLDKLIDSSLWLESIIGERLPAHSLQNRRTDSS